ncbi:lysophospholipid acyltransferase family protein [Oceanihabitans sediminis]|uniref:Lipid A biosynthesis acyltransferase n=1 Tax=Oceanihabitans sediminis TaxID=1812012 RepID=A0A368P8J0_9FLAO|nr:lysophospholipid acyltransferase family protein [Oceanihabitans sediminis]MDX1277575.1 lysophospholipid acyltransferase family protein [Oceanihabitans sediminis]MDX1773472.1 lysophospholipid acyltransferase family protein [Oceanihabitans sediminis]RBP32927.1 KDO2-lipid IV(A) lauroyltransferase [Oceanihabitans sediminis]RCU57551.1 lipid A biosynthesis acyltransferase [Oceanihabitans sediminis]
MQFLVYIIIYPLLWVISILPFRLLYAISDFLFVVVYYIIGYRKKTVTYNLKLVFPEKSDSEIKDIQKKFYAHLCDMILESIKSLTISEEEMIKRFKLLNVEEIHKLEVLNKNIVLQCGHYGNFEWIFILQKFVNHKGYGVYKRLANKYFDKLIKRKRAKYNTELITTKETIQTLLHSKAKGELSISGFISDQSPKKDKAYYWNEFLGIKVPIHTGAEMLAKKLDSAVVFFAVKKIKRGYYETTFQTIAVNPLEYKNYELTDRYLKLVEEQIYEAPEYYLWTHKRFKHKDEVPAEFQ